jgi:O-methyltransferase
MTVQQLIDQDADVRAEAKRLIWNIIKDNRLVLGDPKEYNVIFEGLTIPRLQPWRGGNEYQTALSDDRFYMIQQLEANAPDGPAVEVGVFTGGVTRYLLDVGRDVWAFDTFEGIVGADQKVDMHRNGEYNAGDVLKYIVGAQVVKGNVQQTMRNSWGDPTIAIAHIDLDVKAPTVIALDWIYQYLHPDGVIIMDDYGSPTCPGVREAVDEFQYGRKLYIPTGQMIIWKDNENDDHRM